MASAGFTRRFLSDPGNEVILAIEGTVIIDREPPAVISGLGSGTNIIVAEFEDGPFTTPTEVFSGTDLLTQFGGFGFDIGGVASNNPSARGRKADGALNAEAWNGNGFIGLVNKKYARLIVVRVDTSVGAVQFDRLACITGDSDLSFDLEPAQTVVLDIGAGDVTATFDAAAAADTGTAGAISFTTGDAMNLTIDDGTTQQIGPLSVTFFASDTTISSIITRVNAALGFTALSESGGTYTLVGRVRGSAGNVVINSIDASVATATGLSVGSTAGTGDVGNIDLVTFTEAKTVIEADITGVTVDRDSNNGLRICAPTSITPKSTSSATGFGFTFDDVAVTAAAGVDTTIPAGTVVSNGSQQWVTVDTIDVTAANAGPYPVRVRPAVDDGTNTGSVPASITTVVNAIPGSSNFSVINLLAVDAALTEAAIDAAYVAAIDSTWNPGVISAEGNMIVSARQSNAVRNQLRSNVITASSEGLRGRVGVIRPPLNTTRVAARSTSSQPGVGAYRNQRVIYAYPGAETFVPQIAVRGTSGGAGFTATGLIDTGFDTWVTSVMSQLPPEENPGQVTNFLSLVTAIEANNTDVQDMRIGDYTAFKASGIAALRISDGAAIIQSGVTSVDPKVNPNFANIARRRMADFIQDTLASRLNAFIKQLNSPVKRSQILGEIIAFMTGLLSPNNTASQRIDSFTTNAKSGNTPDTLALGIFRIILKVRTLSSLDDIVLDTEIGESVVTVTETVVPLAA